MEKITCEDLEKRLLGVRRKKTRKKKIFRLVFLLFAVWAIFHFVIGLAVVEGDSMRPTLVQGDIVIYSKWPFLDFTYGDIILVPYSDGAKKHLIKRIAGLPGDLVKVDDLGYLTRNGKCIDEPEVLYGHQESERQKDFLSLVPEGCVFCLGDNRPISLDSRDSSLGFVKKEQIAGKVISILRMP